MRCDECGNDDIFTDHERGELICTNCGLVLDQQLILRQEVSYPEEETLHYHIDIPKLVDRPRTIIGNDKVDSAGKEINQHKVYKLRKSMKYENNIIIKRSERLIKVIESQLDLPPVVRQKVKYYFSKLRASTRGKPHEVLVTTAFMIATRHLKIPLSFTTLAKFTKSSAKRIQKGYITLIQELQWNVPILKSKDFVPSFCEKLGVNGDVRSRVLEFLGKHSDTWGKDPKLVAASLIYHFACPEVTQLQIANICKVSEVGIRNTLKWFELR